MNFFYPFLADPSIGSYSCECSTGYQRIEDKCDGKRKIISNL